ncbi:hypothetical protein [Geminocystis herdmanii]|uniref:hypothetical protein n=1 Tax=Geminocystis herdmanii TaxID=669359 RepID=UPI00034B687C|nr:hypothetical protein [Geminocystis herdmanii]
METITIKVDQEVAQLYQSADVNKQENATKICNFILKEILKSSSFEEIVSQIRQEAQINGLTSEILTELLKDD